MRGNGPDQRKEAGGSALTVDPAARSGKLAFYPSTARFLLRGGLDRLLGLGSRLLLLPRLGKQALLRSGQDGLKFLHALVAQIIHLLLQALDLGVILGLDLVQLLFLLVSEPELGVPGRHAVRHIGGSRLAGRLRGGATVRGSGSRSISLRGRLRFAVTPMLTTAKRYIK